MGRPRTPATATTRPPRYGPMHRNFMPASRSESAAAAFVGAGADAAAAARSVAIRQNGRTTEGVIVFSGARSPFGSPHGRAKSFIVASENPDSSLAAGYAAALLLELLDQPVKGLIGVAGGHPLKHPAAAAGFRASS